MTERSPPLRLLVPLALVLLAGGLGWGVAHANAAGGGDRLARYREEYAGGGSCKWRGHDAFQRVLLLGLLGFPLSVAGALGFAHEARRRQGPGRWRAGLGAALGLAVLGWLWSLGFVGPALELCP